MTKSELYELSKKGTVEIGGVPCRVEIKPDKDGDLWCSVIVENISPLHATAVFGGKLWKYVTDDECEELPGALKECKRKADEFCEDAKRVVKAHFNSEKKIVIDEIPFPAKEGFEGLRKIFLREKHRVQFIDNEKTNWHALGHFTLDIDGHKYVPHWSFWLDRAYYKTDEYLKGVFENE